MFTDYNYMSIILSNLSGIPVRLYRENIFQALYYPNSFKPDLAILEEENILCSSTATVSYYLTEQFLFFGLFRVKTEPVSFILGPVTMITPDRNHVRDILRAIGEPMNRDTELLNYLQSIPGYPLRNFLQILCAFDYFINSEQKSVGDLLLEDVPVAVLQAAGHVRERDEEGSIHNTYELERQLLSDVEYGRIDSIRAMMQAPTQGRAGKIAHNALRQQKNLLVCTATLVSRAAIQGGMPTEEAFALSDLCIQKAELLNDYSALMRLQAQLVLDFTEKVERLRSVAGNGPLSREVRSYALRHISRRISTEELAERLGLNRTYLCKRFKEETGQSVADYITDLRLNEAKRLLATSKKPLGEIAESLGFSSQSHFQNVFKKSFVLPLRSGEKQTGKMFWKLKKPANTDVCGLSELITK